MKKGIALILTLIVTAALLGGCAPTDPGANADDFIPTVMVKDTLYYGTGHESDITGRCGVPDGQIMSTVDSSKTPTKDNQSNFGTGYEYQFVDEDSIDVYTNEKWMRFEKDPEVNAGDNTAEPDAWGIRLSASAVTPTGLTLLCEQSGGHATGELQTGSKYWLETRSDHQWVPVNPLSEEEIFWTAIAYLIPKNDSVEWEVKWEQLYGALPAGTYRIGKEINDFRKTADYDTNNYYAEFEIKD